MIGIDVIEVERVKQDDGFLNKIAHPQEIDYIKQNPQPQIQRQKIAALWAVKEAVIKALELGSGSGVVLKDIMLYHQPNGKPEVRLAGVALEALTKRGGKRVEVSLSHSKTVAVAVAIVV